MRNGKWIRQVSAHLNVAIQRHGWKAKDLAVEVGMDQGSLSKVRMGYEPLRVHHVPNLLKALPSLPKKAFKVAALRQYTSAELKRQGVHLKRP